MLLHGIRAKNKKSILENIRYVIRTLDVPFVGHMVDFLVFPLNK